MCTCLPQLAFLRLLVFWLQLRARPSVATLPDTWGVRFSISCHLTFFLRQGEKELCALKIYLRHPNLLSFPPTICSTGRLHLVRKCENLRRPPLIISSTILLSKVNRCCSYCHIIA